LIDIRAVFNEHGGDRISSASLCAALRDLDDRPWDQYRGPDDNQPPRRLTQVDLSVLLDRFDIWPKPLWPSGPRRGAERLRGYRKAWFEDAWAAYLDEEEAESAPDKPPLRIA
jgi:hypothetical protein